MRRERRMAPVCPDVAAEYGLSVNQNGGLYRRGVSYDTEKKIEVNVEIERTMEANNGAREPVWNGRQCGIRRESEDGAWCPW